ncbi:orotate phosphoribosyltransferase [Jeotgalibaca sp. MA1X17-3]|uniref:orotate phosphoribosyltransferase n=1 Tax=Jeotgalibaca sp. MA1X17-3 TaxID=2908211 RepID=UPI001F2C672A|nr:orotate phosphoribosyltransferase [Jeotgalibaca sp. MA1X17-3]UJF14758.1 orotate phosphoribosyltransferase [Jeotgalibaca sp. MA1X17-3]
MNISEEVAKALLDIKAVTLSPTKPYTWASGIKSPIYCDNRITISVPSVRKKIALSLANLIKEKYPDVEVIAGTATAGIPHAAFVAQILDLPMIYIRSKAKEHGKTNQVEGRLENGQKVVLIEDLISTGGSVIEASKATEEAGANVLGCVAIFTYEMALGKNNFATSGFELHCLSNYSTLLEVAQREEYISKAEFELLINWSKAPENWQPII